MRRRRTSLRRQLLGVAAAQALAIAGAAVIIAWFTLPGPRGDGPRGAEHRPPGSPAPGGRGPEPPGGTLLFPASPAAPRPPPRRDGGGLPLGVQLTLAAILAVLLLGHAWIARALLRPLRRLQGTVRRLAAGEFEVRAALGRDDEIGALGEALDGLAEHVEQLLRAERALVANISHELRTPLARVRVALDLLEDGPDPAAADATTAEAKEARRADLAGIRQDLDEVESLLADIFAASRLDAATPASQQIFQAERTPLGAGLLVQRAGARFRGRRPGRPLALAVAEDAPRVLAHPLLLRRAVENLLENADKYSPDPKAEIRVSVRRGADGSAEIAVADGGRGIPEAEQARLFEPFYRGHGARAEGIDGVGLGLSLVRRVVVAHGGEIGVESVPEQGTTVRLRLPAA